MKFNPTLHKLSNGVTVILDPMDIETTAIKIYVKGGTRIEQPHEYGISHFIEHMLFKGTEKYATGKQMRDILRDNGGARGASTSVASTSYTGRILAENFSVLLDVLSDMVLNSTLKQNNIDTERGVITQEINRSQDNEARKFIGLVKRNIFSDHYLSKYDGLGTIETISTFDSKKLAAYKKAKYTANNIIIGISGKIIDSNKILSELERLFSVLENAEDASVNSGKITPSVIYDVRDDRKQTKLFIGFDSLYSWEREYDFPLMCVGVFENALSQRLFTEIVEEKGLVYSFGRNDYGDKYLSSNGFETALSPEKLADVIASIARHSYDILHNNPVTPEELNRRKAMTKLGRADFLESSVSRCDRLVGCYAMYNELYNPAEFDEMRARITPDDIIKYSADYFSSPISMIAQGPKCDIDMKAVWDENFK